MAVVLDTGWTDVGAVRSGVPVRWGLVWLADPGVTFVTATTDEIGTTCSRSGHARELRSIPDAPFYTTTEWMTLQVEGSSDWSDLMLGWARFE